MAREPRIVAELGRPETPEETAARKAANSKAYRESQSFRSLIIALLATVVVVAVIFLAVPRGGPAAEQSVDPKPAAELAAESYDRTVIVPDVPEPTGREGNGWFVNAAKVVPGSPAAWEILYVPGDDSFLRFVQGFDADETWASQQLGGTAPSGEVVVDGVEWQEYEVDPRTNANVTYALGTQAGSDHILLYGTSSAEKTAEVAEMIAPQVRALTEEQG
ncbi:DUF4245 family protein [Microbacterium marinilacus]|uniref:DUF4245 domain-containing protein n=1 Tax=Microbacterium marinilacus TaxID=415209 RepID=A0ABP7B8E7_9MICO|nr:DUF4245 family protein [Microbacterium marinilacus]MBY0687432.1 DUF4245 domain-containing protein [Microbacterium marinilacus]